MRNACVGSLFLLWLSVASGQDLSPLDSAVRDFALVASPRFPVWYAGLARHGIDDRDRLVTVSIITPRGGGGAVTMRGPLSMMLKQQQPQ